MRSRSNYYNVLIIVFFFLMLIIPLMKTHLDGGEISTNEKRRLADIPSANNLNVRIWNREFMQEFEDWLNDHIGARNISRNIYAQIMKHIFGLSTSDDVVFGFNHYCYYNKNNNLEIAKGTYPLREEDLQIIEDSQNRIFIYYKANDIRYILLLTPSKVSIYPENLPFVPEDQIIQPAELIEQKIDGIGEVINVKEPLLNNKKQGNLFFLTDTHWNTFGSYIAYCTLIKKIDPTTNPIEGKWIQGKRTGDLYQQLNLISASDQELVPVFEYNWKSNQITSEEIDPHLMDEIRTAFDVQNTTYVDPEVFVNNNIEDGTLLIYGDSMMAGYLNMPRYLCEHFHKVIVLRLRQICPEIDRILNPDIVIYSTTERLIKNALTNFANQLN